MREPTRSRVMQRLMWHPSAISFVMQLLGVQLCPFTDTSGAGRVVSAVSARSVDRSEQIAGPGDVDRFASRLIGLTLAREVARGRTGASGPSPGQD